MRSSWTSHRNGVRCLLAAATTVLSLAIASCYECGGDRSIANIVGSSGIAVYDSASAIAAVSVYRDSVVSAGGTLYDGSTNWELTSARYAGRATRIEGMNGEAFWQVQYKRFNPMDHNEAGVCCVDIEVDENGRLFWILQVIHSPC